MTSSAALPPTPMPAQPAVAAPPPAGASGRLVSVAPRLMPLVPGTILDACEPIFAALIALRASASSVEPQTFYNTLADQLAIVRAAAKAGGLNHAEVEAVAFALAAFADEAVMSSGWAGRSQWPFLQYTEFRTHRAGEEFFEILAQHRQSAVGPDARGARPRDGAAARVPQAPGDDPLAWNDPARAAVLEVYYVCLMLGFRGKYAVTAPEQYQQELARMRSHIQARSVLPLGPVGFPPRYDARSLHVLRWQWPAVGYLLLIVVVTVLVAVTLYIHH